MTSKQYPIIDVRQLTRVFGDLTALTDVSFTVPAGSIFALLGPNGAGKSTMIKILTTLLTPSSGAILVNGHNPVIHPDEVRRSLGIVFQDPSLDDELTAKENMELHGVLYGVPKSLRRERIQHLLTFVDLWDRKDDFVKNFSGGMKRRLEIARGLLHHPKILFLDEPTLGLDPQTRSHMWEYILRLNQSEGMTIFFTTHYIEEAEQTAQTVAIIDHGKLIAEGSPGALKTRTGSATLEQAFLALTGSEIRTEGASGADRMRMRHKVWHR